MRREIQAMNDRLAEVAEAEAEDVLEDVVVLLREAAGLYDARDRPGAARLMRHLAEALNPDDTDLSEKRIDYLLKSGTPVQVVASPDELAQHVTRSIFALKTPSPSGSGHYQSGWDDGLEAAMDTAKDAILSLFKKPGVTP